MNTDSKLQKCSNRNRFKEDKRSSLRSVPITIPILQNKVINEQLNVVKANVPFVVGLHLLRKYEMYVNDVKKLLFCTFLNVNISLQRKHTHINLFLANDSKILYTGPEFLGLHKTLLTSLQKSFIRYLNYRVQEKNMETNTETKRTLKKIQRQFDAHQNIFFMLLYDSGHLFIAQTTSNLWTRFCKTDFF